MEGHLLKYSSGALTSRWQKRYFVLRDSELEYSGSGGSVVRFPVRRIQSVSLGDRCEFELQIGSSRRTRKYQIRADSIDVCRSWVRAIETVVTKFQSGADDSHVDNASSSYKTNNTTVLGEDEFDEQPILPNTLDPVCEMLVSSDEIEAMFAVWFAHTGAKAGTLIDGCTRAVSDLLAVLGSVPRGEFLQLDAVLCAKIKQRISLIGPLAAKTLIEQYICKIIEKIQEWILVEHDGKSGELPVVIEWVARLEKELAQIQSGTSLLTGLICRLGAEWEVATIQEIQKIFPNESVWDTSNPQKQTPSFLHAVFAPTLRPVLLSNWIFVFMNAVNEHCLSRSTKGTSWELAYSSCIAILTSHCGNALVASLNSAWRVYKTRASKFSNYKKNGVVNKTIRRFSGVSPQKPISTELSNMVAFGNEATLISIFCQHASGVADLRISSPVFGTCMEGLSVAYANTAKEISRSITRIHFSKKNEKILKAIFDPKSLYVRVSVPVADSLDLCQEFINMLVRIGCHDLLKYLIVGHVMSAIASHYISSLLFHKPKMSKFTRLSAVVAEDEGLFFSFFRDLGRPPTEINAASTQMSHVRSVLSDEHTEGAHPSITLIRHCVELFSVFPSFPNEQHDPIDVIKALLDVKGISKIDKRDIIDSVTACMQKKTTSPQVQLWDDCTYTFMQH